MLLSGPVAFEAFQEAEREMQFLEQSRFTSEAVTV